MTHPHDRPYRRTVLCQNVRPGMASDGVASKDADSVQALRRRQPGDGQPSPTTTHDGCRSVPACASRSLRLPHHELLASVSRSGRTSVRTSTSRRWSLVRSTFHLGAMASSSLRSDDPRWGAQPRVTRRSPSRAGGGAALAAIGPIAPPRWRTRSPVAATRATVGVEHISSVGVGTRCMHTW